MTARLATRRVLQIALALLVALQLPTATLVAQADSFIDIPGPPGSGAFGTTVTALPNGNFVVTDPLYDAGPIADVGAVYLYDGLTNQLISTLVGGTAGDQIGIYGVITLTNGNFVVFSQNWSNGAAAQAGAVTWCSETTGCSGPVTAANSLVGSASGDHAGMYGVTALSNGNYVVLSPDWHNGAVAQAGAVTWCRGTAGCTGAITSANSLVGSATGDMVGGQVTALSNGNYVVSNSNWHNGAVANAGAVTWCSGTAGCSGPVTAANSLVGSASGDYAGVYGVTALSNGNYVVLSPDWHNGGVARAGAVTWCRGTAGCTGLITASNSLVGSTANDSVGGGYTESGGGGVTALSNGNYVVRSPNWDHGALANVGAATWCRGTAGCTGPVTAANSLVGSTANDLVGSAFFGGASPLPDGNFVVLSSEWNNGVAARAGAATWCSGDSGCAGRVVSISNSLVGGTADDQIGSNGITVLTNGNYVVRSPDWHNGAAPQAGAVTWCRRTAGCTGLVTPGNSLVGSAVWDQVGGSLSDSGITVLSNGNYVVRSPNWDNGVINYDAGAATWCSGTTGCTGPVTTSNSLVGSTTFDRVGFGGIITLSNGNYVVASPNWSDDALAEVGAATWCNGISGCAGPVTTANSLVGSTAHDEVGLQATPLLSGNYVVDSSNWSNGALPGAGAATWCSGTVGCSGRVTTTNSLVGSTAYDYVGGVTALRNGNYVVFSGAGAAAWCSGTAGCSGPVTTTNSLVGSTAHDQVGLPGTALRNGNYVVFSPAWANGAAIYAGPVTIGNGLTRVVVADDSQIAQVIVGRPVDNSVSLLKLYRVRLPVVARP